MKNFIPEKQHFSISELFLLTVLVIMVIAIITTRESVQILAIGTDLGVALIGSLIGMFIMERHKFFSGLYFMLVIGSIFLAVAGHPR